MNIIGNLHEDTFVGWTGSHAWTVNIIERYHSETELDEDDVDAIIKLLKKAKQEMLEAKAEYMRKETKKNSMRWTTPGQDIQIGGRSYKTL